MMAENMDFCYLPQSYHRLTFKTYFSAFRKIVSYEMFIYVRVLKEVRKMFFFIEITPRLPLTPGLPSSKVFCFPQKMIRRMIQAIIHRLSLQVGGSSSSCQDVTDLEDIIINFEKRGIFWQNRAHPWKICLSFRNKDISKTII